MDPLSKVQNIISAPAIGKNSSSYKEEEAMGALEEVNHLPFRDEELIEEIRSKSACYSTLAALTSGKDFRESAEGMAAEVKDILYTQLGALLLGPLARGDTVKELGQRLVEDSTLDHYTNKIRALSLVQPLDDLYSLLSRLEEEKTNIFALYQYHYLLPVGIAASIDRKIQALQSASSLSVSTFIGKIGHPDVLVAHKKQAVVESIDEYKYILLKMEKAALDYHISESSEAKLTLILDALDQILMPLLSKPVEKSILKKIDRTCLTSVLTGYLQRNVCYTPYLAQLVGSLSLDTTLTPSSKTYTMSSRLEMYKEDKDYPSGLDTLVYQGEIWKVLSLNVSAKMNMDIDRCVSVGEGVINREMIAFDPSHSTALDQFYTQNFRDNPFFKKNRELTKQLALMVRTIHLAFRGVSDEHPEQLVDAYIARWKRENPFEENPASYFISSDGRLTPIIPLDTFINEKIGVCRHLSLITGYCITRAQKEFPELFSCQGKILHMRSSLEGGQGHAWTWFQPNNGTSMIHLDPMWDEVIVLDSGSEDDYSSKPYIQELKKRVKQLCP
ncbi:MAG: hypothetical protein EBZ47_08240 [Chlamydiae bacterium]|nr:hypothetical protein [Chlamydiota bacterium]